MLANFVPAPSSSRLASGVHQTLGHRVIWVIFHVRVAGSSFCIGALVFPMPVKQLTELIRWLVRVCWLKLKFLCALQQQGPAVTIATLNASAYGTRDVKTVDFSEPVTGLPKPVFYRLPKGLL